MNNSMIRKRKPWDIGTWTWLLNRIAGVTIIVYLLLHICVIGTARSGPAAFNGVMDILHNPLALFLEFILIMAVAAHGLNGLRHILVDFGLFSPEKHVRLLTGASIACAVLFLAALGLLFA